MTKKNSSQKADEETLKGENPPAEKVSKKEAENKGKTFQGKGREVRK